MAAATAGVPRQELYGIGFCKVGTEYREFDIAWPEVDRDTMWMERVFNAAGLSAQDEALVTLPNWEGPWFGPLLTTLRRYGIVHMLAENYSWDARRAGHMIRSLKPTVVVGLCADTLEGLKGQGDDVAELLSGVGLIWARHDALNALGKLGIAAQPLVPLGPALAIGVPGVGAVVNSDEWDVTAVDGELVVSTAGRRATAFTNVRTGINGAVGEPTDLGTRVEFEL